MSERVTMDIAVPDVVQLAVEGTVDKSTKGVYMGFLAADVVNDLGDKVTDAVSGLIFDYVVDDLEAIKRGGFRRDVEAIIR